MSEKINILVTGANGQLGKSLQQIQDENKQLKFYFFHKAILDITEIEQIDKVLSEQEFSYCINTAAYTNVDKSEIERDKCMNVNVEGTKNLALALNKRGIKLIQISSDYVYHNHLRRPLLEYDPTTPKGVYARSKLLGEQVALDSNSQTTIFRTSWLYSPFGSNFIKTILSLFSAKEKIHVVDDQIGQLTYAIDLARVIARYILFSNNDLNAPDRGIFNFSNVGEVSWFDVAKKLKNITRAVCEIHAISTEAYGSPVDRPPYSVLNIAKVEKTLKLQGLPYLERLEDCLKQRSVI